MKSSHNIYRTGFGDQPHEIECNNQDAYDIVEFLFSDFPETVSAKAPRFYNIISASPLPTLSLWEKDKQLYHGISRYQLAYTLMNEVIFHCIKSNDSNHALHAGAVYRDGKCFILPGKSGNGKSTLTGWLIKNGFQYLTDELVFLTPAGQVQPMTRPISLKVGPSHPSWLLQEKNQDIICSDTGSMIPHRLLNPKFDSIQPTVTDIIFPQYYPEAGPDLKRISPAKSSLYLLQSHVNARNLQGHGVSALASIVKQCRSFTLSYGSFDHLHALFNVGSDIFP